MGQAPHDNPGVPNGPKEHIKTTVTLPYPLRKWLRIWAAKEDVTYQALVERIIYSWAVQHGYDDEHEDAWAFRGW